MSSDFDSDIKIYVKKSDSENSDFKCISDSIDFHIANGNREKAVELGAALATLKPTDEKLEIALGDLATDSNVLYQARVLITFLCEEEIKNNITIPILSDTVYNSMYDTLKENENGYFKNIVDGAAFSFYRLANKKGKSEIGKAYAKLCGASEDSAYSKIGESVYDKSVPFIRQQIASCEFSY